MIVAGSLIVVAVFVLAYDFWLNLFGDRPQLKGLHNCFAFIPPIVGLAGVVVLWLAFARDCRFALSLRWSIGGTVILALVAIAALIIDVFWYFDRVEKPDLGWCHVIYGQ
jgi:hypothetical protein